MLEVVNALNRLCNYRYCPMGKQDVWEARYYFITPIKQLEDDRIEYDERANRQAGPGGYNEDDDDDDVERESMYFIVFGFWDHLHVLHLHVL